MFKSKKFGMLVMCAVAFIASGLSNGCGTKKAELSAADQQKMAALGDALKNGILTQTEYDAKVKELNAAAGKQPSAADAQKLQALENACKSGALSAEECATKRAALTGAATTSGQVATPATGMAVVSAPADAPAPASAPAPSSASMPDNSNAAVASNPQMSGGNGGSSSGNSAMANGGGSSYRDPQGAFQLVVPQGWNVSPQGTNGSDGVQIVQGTSWAVISPFANAKQPSDVVISVEGQLQRQYKNMAIGNHGPAKFQGKLDMAYARYTGINPQGAAVTVVIIGIASPDGRFFLVMSSIPQNDTQGANNALTAMVQSLHFGGV